MIKEIKAISTAEFSEMLKAGATEVIARDTYNSYCPVEKENVKAGVIKYNQIHFFRRDKNGTKIVKGEWLAACDEREEKGWVVIGSGVQQDLQRTGVAQRQADACRYAVEKDGVIYFCARPGATISNVKMEKQKAIQNQKRHFLKCKKKILKNLLTNKYKYLYLFS